ncbi:MAG: Asp-tRNA(Asn)/Glu-tRNA(Gln) amidotransferase subunit GatA [Candidatus Levybacteria bacterium]|nr:Asp-tRNA(Asn)/Glu-tRNA(Gln) amidotransferase subunit GatA [Candidatus Levybacteria bacterium]MBP9815466.1 Asp-tRNA(Asn)/Glu-tRNA(Gln) amidotransferase subunit GatA [Candidatus Levybacteria bacterium]
MNLSSLTLKETITGLAEKKFSSTEITQACIKRIKEVEPKINALVTVTEKEALESAKKADEALSSGVSLPLLGIPFIIKDNFTTFGIKTTASSKLLDSYVPPFDSTVVKKLKDAGIVMIGKSNMDAWAHGSSTETSDYGATKNPWNTNHLPGGSSGGSAAAIAADEAIAAIGSETAGSIRQPASWCGIVGLKPTYGRVSRYGVIAMGSSLDSPGPMTKTAEDSALILQVLAGHDPLDATTSPKVLPILHDKLNDPISGLTIGVSDDYFEGVDNEVSLSIKASLKLFEKMGAKIKKIKLFPPKYSIAVYTIIQRSEVSSNLARFDGVRYGADRSHFGDEAKRRIMLGTYTLSAGYYDAFYKKAQQVRTIIIQDFNEAFKNVDVIVAPTSPTPALTIGASNGQSMFGELADLLVEPSSIAGLPGINVRSGFTKSGLPIGLQIIGRQFSEELILRFAHQFEKETNFINNKPNI